MNGLLHQYFVNNSQKRTHKWLHYFDIYERHFERFRQKSPTVVEIGVRGGGSLQMWKSYFGDGCRVVGIDIDPDCKRHEEDGIDVFIGSQDDPALWEGVLHLRPNIDIVIDDGSHLMQHMTSTFDIIYPRMSPYGVYLVEDAHTSYNRKYGGGLMRQGSFMEFVKGKLDEINAIHTKGAVPVSDFTRSTNSISCYDGVVAFEKRPQARRQAIITEKM